MPPGAPPGRWLQEQKLATHVVGEFDDSALMKSFGEAGVGLFPVPEVILEGGVSPLGSEPAGRLMQDPGQLLPSPWSAASPIRRCWPSDQQAHQFIRQSRGDASTTTGSPADPWSALEITAADRHLGPPQVTTSARPPSSSRISRISAGLTGYWR